MRTTKNTLRAWFDEGKAAGKEFMMVGHDTFDHEDYPVFCSRHDFSAERAKRDGVNMQRIIEVYDLSQDRETQMAEGLAWHCPQPADSTPPLDERRRRS